MPLIDFAGFHYYPALQSSAPEHLGYRNLSNDDKAALLPIFELSQRGDAPDLTSSLEVISESAVDRPFLLDLCKDPAPPPFISQNPRDLVADRERVEAQREAQASYNTLLAGLLNPSDGFAVWRELVARFPNAVPVLQYTDAAAQSRQILRQAALLAQTNNCLAIRVTVDSDPSIANTVAQIISIISAPENLLIILDCGQGRQLIDQRAGFARDTITRILNNLEIAEQSRVQAVCMSNSFPRPNHDGLRGYVSMDWRLWRSARDAFPFMYGDYGATHRIRRQNTYMPADWRAAVTYPLNEEWKIYRHLNANDSQGWIDGSVAVMADASFDAQNCWGVDLIRQASTGNLQDANSTRFWYAAKVNIHIHRQLPFARDTITLYDGDEEP